MPALPVAAQPATGPKWSALEEALGKEDYAEARKLADAIVQRGAPDDRAKAAAVYGRILLGLGQADGARQYLAMQAKQGFAPRQAAIYAAWLLAADGKPDEAAASLENMLQQAGESPDADLAEAADVLAMLQMARGETEKAKKAVDFGLKVLQYHGTKDGYVLALLRGRPASNFTAGEAKRLYDQAEKLRKEEKYQPAGQLYARVQSLFPADEYGHASGFRVGQCYVGLNRATQAIDWWRKFIDQSPAGPWRGQARVTLVDAALESQLDLATATEHAMAANTILDKPLEQAAEPSWTSATHDIRLRYGIVSLAEGRFDAAVQALEQARLTAPKSVSEQLLAGLDRLTALAENRRRLTPEELASGDPRTVAALTLGGIYNLLGWHERARGFFTMVISGPTRSSSAAHRAYARLGLARALLASAGPDVVKLTHVAATYESGIKEHPQGTWHDETLRELALLLEYAAAVQFAPAPAKKEDEETPPAAVSDAQRQQLAKSLRAARARALPHWTALAARYPASLHAPQALYHAGILHTEAERPAEAVAAFERLVTAHPKSPWAGDAHVRLIDVKLERQFDLPAAARHAQAAVVWYGKAAGTEEGSGAAASADGTTERACYFVDGITRALPSLRETGYAIYLRAGLVAYLTERPEEAAGFFEQAKPLQPERGFVVVHGEIPTGMERLLALARANRQLTPDIVRQGDPKAKLMLMLADVYHEAEQWRQSLDLSSRVIDSAAPKATREQRSYAHFRRGRNYFRYLDRQRDRAKDRESAISDYVAAVRAARNAPWADKAMFLAGNLVWNHRRDAEGAMTIWRRLIAEYPNSEEAHRSAYYIAVVYQWRGREAEAHKAYQGLIAQFPDSPFVKLARSRLSQMEAQPSSTSTP